jgi:hypothetical protein
MSDSAGAALQFVWYGPGGELNISPTGISLAETLDWYCPWDRIDINQNDGLTLFIWPSSYICVPCCLCVSLCLSKMPIMEQLQYVDLYPGDCLLQLSNKSFPLLKISSMPSLQIDQDDCEAAQKDFYEHRANLLNFCRLCSTAETGQMNSRATMSY